MAVIRMRKFDDFFTAGVLLGMISVLPTNLLLFCLNLISPKIVPPWANLAMLFFKPPQLFTFWAQFFGFVVNLGIAALNGIIVGWLLRFSGRDFAYIKSTMACSGFTVFMFMVVNPLLGGQAVHGNIITTYLALITTVIFAIIFAYLFLRFTTVGLKRNFQ
jgi:hypothetical protein